MRKREHAGFVTQNATDQPPGLGEIWNCILKGHKSVGNVKQSEYAESSELRVMVCLHKVYERPWEVSLF